MMVLVCAAGCRERATRGYQANNVNDASYKHGRYVSLTETLE